LERNAQNYGVEGVTNYDDMAAIVNWNPKGGRVADKPSLTKDELPPTLEADQTTLKDGGENSTIVDSLLIRKSDLDENIYKINSNRTSPSLDDDLPF